MACYWFNIHIVPNKEFTAKVVNKTIETIESEKALELVIYLNEKGNVTLNDLLLNYLDSNCKPLKGKEINSQTNKTNGHASADEEDLDKDNFMDNRHVR